MHQTKTATLGLMLISGVLACSGHVNTPRAVSAVAAPAGPDWQQLDSTCQGGITSDPARCSLVAEVKEITGMGTYHHLLLTQFVSAQGVRDLGALASTADQACAEGYPRACVAARLAKCWGKLSEARWVQGRNQAVQTEYNLAVQALARQVIKVSSTTGEAVAGPDFDEAEPHADAALATAKAVVEATKDAQASAETDKARHSENLAGEKECETDSMACEAACAADGASDKCWLLALLHCTTGPDGACLPHWSKAVDTNLSKARELAARSCKAGNAHGCDLAATFDRTVAARTESLWSTVAAVGDDLVQKQYAATVAKQWGAAQPRLQRQLPQIIAMNQAIVRDNYCPAKKAFIQSVSLAEFQRRSANHCQTAAPLGQGVSGAQVTLTSECTAVYAMPCP